MDVSVEQVDAIVIEELKFAYDINRIYNDEPSKELREALDRVLKYYMVPSEYEEYIRTLE
jgi:hypothetical protein